MEGFAGVFQNISKLDEDQQLLYLEGLLDHQSILRNPSNAKSLTQTINTALSKETSSKHALQTLNVFLKQCTNEVFEEYAQFWTSCTLKALNVKKSEDCSYLVYEVLGKIAQRAKECNGFSATFAHTHLAKIYENLSSLDTNAADAALKCIEICLRCYPGPSGPAKVKVEQFLLSHIDTTNSALVKRIAKCQHLLLQVRGGGKDNTTYRAQWQTYQTKLLGSLHEIMNEMFSKCTLINNIISVKEQLETPALKCSDEPVQRQVLYYIRFHNLINCLTYALSEPFPSEKPILPKMILALIERGINLSTNIGEKNKILDNLALTILVPKMQLDLMKVLRTLILCLGTHSKMFCGEMLNILSEILLWSSTKQVSLQKPYAKVRTEAYEILFLWCTLTKYGNCCEIVMDLFVKEIMYDICVQNNNVLQVQAETKTQISKKARKQAFKLQNQESNISLNHDMAAAKREMSALDADRVGLCTAALKCLQKLIATSGVKLKSATMNLIQKNVLETLYTIIDVMPLNKNELYFNWKCRLELYNLLYAIQLRSHRMCPPATMLVFEMLNRAYQQETVIKVQQHCGELLLQLEKLAHPQKEGLLFPIELRNLQCSFAKRNNDMDFLQDVGNSEISVKQQEYIAKDVVHSETSIVNVDVAENIFKQKLDSEISEEGKNVNETIIETVSESASEDETMKENSDATESDECMNEENDEEQIITEQLNKPTLMENKQEESINTRKSPVKLDNDLNCESNRRKLEDNDKLFKDIEAVFVDEFDE